MAKISKNGQKLPQIINIGQNWKRLKEESLKPSKEAFCNKNQFSYVTKCEFSKKSIMKKVYLVTICPILETRHHPKIPLKKSKYTMESFYQNQYLSVMQFIQSCDSLVWWEYWYNGIRSMFGSRFSRGWTLGQIFSNGQRQAWRNCRIGKVNHLKFRGL